MNPSTFNLFGLPHVIFSDALSAMEIKDILAFSSSSKEVSKLVKLYRRKAAQMKVYVKNRSGETSLTLERGDVENFKIKIVTPGTDHDEPFQYWTIGVKLIPVCMDGDDCLLVFWEDQEEGLKYVIKYVCELFQTHIFRLDVCEKTMDWIKFIETQQFQNYGCGFAEFDGISDEKYSYLLEKCRASNLSLCTSPSKSFSGDEIKFRERDSLHISDAAWFKIDHLLKLDCIEVSATLSEWTNKDINQLSKMLVVGVCPRLQWVRVSLDEEFRSEELYMEMRDRVVAERNREYKRLDGATEKPKSREIRCDNGCTISLVSPPFTKQLLVIYIWPANNQ